MTVTTNAPTRQAVSRGVAMTDRKLERFLSAPRSASLAYARRDGSPFVVPVWFRWRDGEVLIGTGAADPKVAAIRRNPRVTVLVHDDRAPYGAVIIDGDASVEVLGPADANPTEGIAMAYLGRIGGELYKQQMAENGAFDNGRAIIRIRPNLIRTNDGSASLPWLARVFAAVRFRLPIPNRWV
jgi:PPOX class probable F420-dependent enzyme